MTLLSDELWSIANNSKSYANSSKSIKRNNLGLCKCSYLIWKFQKYFLGSNDIKIQFGKERDIKQINDLWEWQKNLSLIPQFSGKRSYLKRIRGYDTGEEGGGSKHSFAGNDKNNVIAN